MSARPQHSDYQSLLHSHDEEADVGEDNRASTSAPSASLTRERRRRTGGGVSIDLAKLDNAFKRWTESIAQKVKRKKQIPEHTKKKIWRSVFEPTILPAPNYGFAKTLDHNPPMTDEDFDAVVQSIKEAIIEGHHPKMIAKGSSGSYFARAKVNGRVQTVAVFKPKDEEPYGRLNPKDQTTKWLHRQFRWLIPFGRACLIPNLSYISEAAASLLDTRLDLHIVPPTKLVSLSSPAFFYDWLDRNAAKKGKALPEKIGSMQFFLQGFQDASEFLRKHPWPGRAISDTFDDSNHRQGSFSKRFLSALKIVCGRTGDPEDAYDEAEADFEEEQVLYDATEETDAQRPFYWTQSLQQSFRDELEKLVILDYLMLNTDRGADNYMIKYCEGEHEKLVDVAPSRSGWRSYTYGWLFLPVSIIGRPFSEKTRNHFLPLLTSKAWWEETTYQLEKLFAVDPDFHPKMFARQLAVIKGQAWNIVQSLKHHDEGPLELTRRMKVLVWDEEVVVPDVSDEYSNAPVSPTISVSSVPIPGRTRSQSYGSDFPPPMRRTATDASGAPRPVPFAAKFQRIHPGTTGVTVLEHLERLDAVEASLQRLGVQEEDQEEEVDMGVSSAPLPSRPMPISRSGSGDGRPPVAQSPFSAPGEPLEPVTEVSTPSRRSSMDEDDLAAMSKSTSHVEGQRPLAGRKNIGTISTAGLDWIAAQEEEDDEGSKTVMIAERLETVKKTPLCSCW
ncbi:hypothetical protein H1R20_g14346, partial [Candolleomyces eurysporus]